MADVDLAVRFFLQLSVILLACRVVGWLGRFLGQTQVVSEMVAGVLLGPSLFGLLLPEAQQWLFPKTASLASGVTIGHPSMSILYVMSQLGLVLYMFVVGLEFDLHLLGTRAKTAAWVSAAGIALPFVLGAAAAFLLVSRDDCFIPGISNSMAALYVGASMCITAFPMLARIVMEQNIAKTSLGTLALAAGAMNDVLAWCMLAIVLASVKGSASIALVAIGGGIAFTAVLILAGRPILQRMEGWFQREGRLSPPIAITVFVALGICAYFTDAIGIYSVFGAFILGACMPRGGLNKALQDNLQHVTGSLLLPIFFVYSGLNTQVGLISGVTLWVLTGLLLLCAIVGKGVGCMLAARAGGETWRNSASIGVLMNARGLMELIILNIGLKQGVITPTLFTMLVLMAIVTTLMTSPLFRGLYHSPRAVAERAALAPAT